jgi:hypothetical protein
VSDLGPLPHSGMHGRVLLTGFTRNAKLVYSLSAT